MIDMKKFRWPTGRVNHLRTKHSGGKTHSVCVMNDGRILVLFVCKRTGEPCWLGENETREGYEPHDMNLAYEEAAGLL